MSTTRYMAWILPSILLFAAHRGSSLSLLSSHRHSFRFVTGLTSSSSVRRTSRFSERRELSNMALSSTATNNDLASVANFVKSVKQRVVDANASDDTKESAMPHLVMGNEAGDADSILSAIGLAYVKTLQNIEDSGDIGKLIVPVVSIPADNLKFQRPETTFLLSDCAGMDNVKDDVNDLIAIDQLNLLPKQATLTLADHNFFRGKEPYEWIVTEIVDHHIDEGKHTDTCPSSKRDIAFEDSRALVASTTTLVAEQFYATATTSEMPPTLAILLLGTILLDSINMSPQAGKGTPRDAAAIKKLLDNTDWAQLTLPDDIVTIDDDGNKGCAPDPTKLFNQLQNAKFSPKFWNGLTAEQAIRMDYKSFSIRAAESSSSSTSSLGLASILLEMTHFCDKHEETLLETMARVMEEDQLEIFGAMFNTFGDGDQRRRQISLASYDKPTLDRLIEYLTVDTTTTPDLKLEVLHREEGKIIGKEEILYVVRMEQNNVAASRKQVAPILMEFFQNHR